MSNISASRSSCTSFPFSHKHFDHIGGTEVFDGAEIITQENGLDILKL